VRALWSLVMPQRYRHLDSCGVAQPADVVASAAAVRLHWGPMQIVQQGCLGLGEGEGGCECVVAYCVEHKEWQAQMPVRHAVSKL
jgi:hypothetical protein